MAKEKSTPKKKWVTPVVEEIKAPKITDLQVALSMVGKSEDDVISFSSAEDGVVLVVLPDHVKYIFRRGQVEAERKRLSQ